MSAGKPIKALSEVSIMRMAEQAKPAYGKQQEILDSIREQRPGIVLENASDAPSVTLHVYGGEMDHCQVFEPVENRWLRRYRELRYTA